jgi:hypothetical protein
LDTRRRNEACLRNGRVPSVAPGGGSSRESGVLSQSDGPACPRRGNRLRDKRMQMNAQRNVDSFYARMAEAI